MLLFHCNLVDQDRKVMKMFTQVINVAQCYPPQPEDGEYPGRDFTEAREESTSAAPSPSRTSTKKKKIVDTDIIKDSEDLGDTHFSCGDDDDSVIPAKPLDSCPPLRVGKKISPKFGHDTS
jgi:hypothetical protein